VVSGVHVNKPETNKRRASARARCLRGSDVRPVSALRAGSGRHLAGLTQLVAPTSQRGHFRRLGPRTDAGGDAGAETLPPTALGEGPLRSRRTRVRFPPPPRRGVPAMERPVISKPRQGLAQAGFLAVDSRLSRFVTPLRVICRTVGATDRLWDALKPAASNGRPQLGDRLSYWGGGPFHRVHDVGPGTLPPASPLLLASLDWLAVLVHRILDAEATDTVQIEPGQREAIITVILVVPTTRKNPRARSAKALFRAVLTGSTTWRLPIEIPMRWCRS
jgi:hypothetical protein